MLWYGRAAAARASAVAIKFNMGLLLIPVLRNVLSYLRYTHTRQAHLLWSMCTCCVRVRCVRCVRHTPNTTQTDCVFWANVQGYGGGHLSAHRQVHRFPQAHRLGTTCTARPLSNGLWTPSLTYHLNAPTTFYLSHADDRIFDDRSRHGPLRQLQHHRELPQHHRVQGPVRFTVAPPPRWCMAPFHLTSYCKDRVQGRFPAHHLGVGVDHPGRHHGYGGTRSFVRFASVVLNVKRVVVAGPLQGTWRCW